ncbi:hypothetical protein MED121_02260 [Marinomonas sp. MED121]|uniref:DUF2804 domain-containing protein n=1 Tax=Marinomonas sp. MED121 TaxID=314277 RepID=UPI0000690B8D|nr:DUF2804 domain-containing protein [Marinomonas sp. MED121]EAQ65997.1 hypothetical protein MED121_02260 [Marinomonas sp. MED121]
MRKLVNESGDIEFGYAKIDTVNYLDFDLRNSMDKPLPKWRKKFKFNQFQFISISCDTFILGLAIVDLKYASNCFVYLYNIQEKSYDEFEFTQALSLNTRMSSQPNSGLSRFKKGNTLVEILAKNNQRFITLKLGNGNRIKAYISEPKEQNPLCVCSRAGYNDWVYTQKNTTLKIEGEINWQGKVFNLAKLNALASVDWSAGFMRRETSWNWANLSTQLADGRKLGFNFASGINETGVSENAIWLEGELIKVDLIHFKFDRYRQEESWLIQSSDKRISLSFHPKGKRDKKLNLYFIASNFRQFFGYFDGTLQVKNETIRLNQTWGLIEDHYAKW